MKVSERILKEKDNFLDSDKIVYGNIKETYEIVECLKDYEASNILDVEIDNIIELSTIHLERLNKLKSVYPEYLIDSMGGIEVYGRLSEIGIDVTEIVFPDKSSFFKIEYSACNASIIYEFEDYYEMCSYAPQTNFVLDDICVSRNYLSSSISVYNDEIDYIDFDNSYDIDESIQDRYDINDKTMAFLFYLKSIDFISKNEHTKFGCLKIGPVTLITEDDEVVYTYITKNQSTKKLRMDVIEKIEEFFMYKKISELKTDGSIVEIGDIIFIGEMINSDSVKYYKLNFKNGDLDYQETTINDEDIPEEFRNVLISVRNETITKPLF